MSVRDALLACVPHGLVESVRNRRMLTQLGAASTKPRLARLAREARLDLLPPGALREIDTVIDVGANEGRWSTAVFLLTRPRRLIAVEPSPQVVPILHAAIGSLPGVSIVEAAVGSSIGEVALNVTAHSHSTSTLPPRTAEMDMLYGGGYEVRSQVVVPLTTIDEITREEDDVSLLKLDVQGAELAAILGASETLGRTRWLMIETNFQSHYEGDMLFPDLHSELTARGFRLTGMSRPFIRSGIALWADSLYERR